MVVVGKKLKILRESKNLSQEYVAESLGISQTAYSKMENNITRLTAKRIQKLSEIFDVPEQEFFQDSQVVFNNNSINYAYINNFIESQKEQYEKTIELLEKNIENQQLLINQLKSENKRMMDILLKTIEDTNK